MVNLPRAPIPGITKTGSPTGNDTLIGEDFDDELHGLGGDDTLKGGYGTDKLYGGIGDDELDGKSSSYLGISGTNPPNQLYGGPDDDTYEAFHGQFGELRVLSRVVQADWNGDRRPDLEIYVNKLGLAADDFIL